MRRLAPLLAAAALAACSSSNNPPPSELRPIGPPPDGGTPPAAPAEQKKPVSILDLYKQSNARRIVERNAKDTFAGQPPHFLKSIVVVVFTVDAQGRIAQSRILRGNGYKDLEKRALDSLRRAAPLEPPPHQLLSRNQLEMTESFLFRDDGKFQIRSIALEQPSVAEYEGQTKRAGRD